MKTLLALSLLCSLAQAAPSNPSEMSPKNAQVDIPEQVDLKSPTREPEANRNVDTIKSVDGVDPTHPSHKKKAQPSSGKKSTLPSGSKIPPKIDSDSSL